MFISSVVLLLWINYCTFILGHTNSGNGNEKNYFSLSRRMRGIKAGSMGFLLSRYQIQEEISHPKWPVYRAIDTKTSQPVSVKLGDSNSHLADEIKIFRELNGMDRDSKYVIQVLDSKITPQGSELVFEYLPASLGTFMYKQQSGKAFSNAQFQVIAKQIVTSLAFMHDHGFVHGNIKPGICSEFIFI
jgi:hypothetical protein